MKQINGPGSLVCGICVLGAAVCAECIPLMIGFVAVGDWDICLIYSMDII